LLLFPLKRKIEKCINTKIGKVAIYWSQEHTTKVVPRSADQEIADKLGKPHNNYPSSSFPIFCSLTWLPPTRWHQQPCSTSSRSSSHIAMRSNDKIVRQGN
jgi:hypothetical protein